MLMQKETTPVIGRLVNVNCTSSVTKATTDVAIPDPLQPIRELIDKLKDRRTNVFREDVLAATWEQISIGAINREQFMNIMDDLVDACIELNDLMRDAY